jgi:hypothetical protein
LHITTTWIPNIEVAGDEVLVEEAGFTRLRRVVDMPLSMELGARP